jgi:MFS family permease
MRQHPIGNGTLTARIPREVAAVMDALQLRGATTDALAGLSKAEWEHLLEFCDVAHLTLQLAQLNSTDFPVWVRDRVAKNLADNEQRFERIRASYEEVAVAFQRAGVPFVVLKGFTQAPEYVRQPRLRMQSDLDFYCPRQEIAKGLAALERIGYRQTGSDEYYQNADHVPTMARVGNWKWRGNSFDPEMPVSVELHFCMWNSSVSTIAIPEVEGFWERRVIRTIDDLSFPALNPVDHLAFAALHILRGVIGGDWVIHHVLELASFLQNHAKDDKFWREWEEVQSQRVRNYTAIAFALAERWFSCAVHARVRAAIDSVRPAQNRWIEKFGGFPLEVMFRRNREGRLLQLLLTESWSARRRVLRNVVLPGSLVALSRAPLAPRFRVSRPVSSNRLIANIAHQSRRVFGAGAAILAFVLHATGLWFSTRSLRREFWLFLVASFFFNLGFSVYFFLFNLFLVGHGYREAQLGVLTSAMAAGNLAGAWPAARLIRRSGLKRALVTCILFTPVVLSTRLFWLPLGEQVPFAFLSGIALSLWAVCFAPMVAKTATEEHRALAFSLVFSVGIGVGALGALIGSSMPTWIVAAAQHVRLHVAAPDRTTLILACIFAALAIVPAASLRLSKSTTSASQERLLLSKPLMRFIPAVAIWGLVTTSFSPFANVFFAVHLKMPLHQVGAVFSISQLIQVIGVLCVPLIFRRWGLTQGILFTQLATSACFLALAASRLSLVSASVYVALTASQWMNEPGIYSLLMKIVPEEQRGGAAASMSFTLGCAQLVSAALAGWGFTRFGYPVVLSTIAAIAVVAAVLFRTIPRRTEHSTSTAFPKDSQDRISPLPQA